jgi:hypothetical protein
MSPSFGYLFFPMRVLLEPFKSREGSVVTRWDEWKGHAVMSYISHPDHGLGTLRVWMSGCRVFSVYLRDNDPSVQMEVYDFSIEGRAKHLSEQVSTELGGIGFLLPAWESGPIPRKKLFDAPAHGVEECIVLTRVSATALTYSLWKETKKGLSYRFPAS